MARFKGLVVPALSQMLAFLSKAIQADNVDDVFIYKSKYKDTFYLSIFKYVFLC